MKECVFVDIGEYGRTKTFWNHIPEYEMVSAWTTYRGTTNDEIADMIIPGLPTLHYLPDEASFIKEMDQYQFPEKKMPI